MRFGRAAGCASKPPDGMALLAAIAPSEARNRRRDPVKS
jgi:hypothetical protein